MSIGMHFSPDPVRAKALDRRMRQQLLDSLEHILGACHDQAPDDLAGLSALVSNLKEGQLASPSIFGLYYEAASALLQGCEVEGLAILREMGVERLLDNRELRLLTLDQVTPQARRQRYQRLMDTDPDTPFRIISPPDDTTTAGISAFTQAYERLRTVLPDLAGEFDALIREVVLVAGAPDLGYQFAGGSCYMLWGALFINAQCHDNDIAMMEAIAHESGHSLLFGFTIDEPLVLNDERALFASPLRDDPRPMDGIYHATYVSARMHWTMSRLLESGRLNAHESDLAASYRTAECRAFWAGHQTVSASALMSETGRALMASATAYMAPFPASS